MYVTCKNNRNAEGPAGSLIPRTYLHNVMFEVRTGWTVDSAIFLNMWDCTSQQRDTKTPQNVQVLVESVYATSE